MFWSIPLETGRPGPAYQQVGDRKSATKMTIDFLSIRQNDVLEIIDCLSLTGFIGLYFAVENQLAFCRSVYYNPMDLIRQNSFL